MKQAAEMKHELSAYILIHTLAVLYFFLHLFVHFFLYLCNRIASIFSIVCACLHTQ